MIIKNIEAKIRLATVIAVASLLTSLAIVGMNCCYSYRLVSTAQKSIYLLDNNIPILARQTDMQMNRPAEYRADVDRLHSRFCSRTPDEKFIDSQMKKAWSLVADSGTHQSNDPLEN